MSCLCACRSCRKAHRTLRSFPRQQQRVAKREIGDEAEIMLFDNRSLRSIGNDREVLAVMQHWRIPA